MQGPETPLKPPPTSLILALRLESTFARAGPKTRHAAPVAFFAAEIFVARSTFARARQKNVTASQRFLSRNGGVNGAASEVSTRHSARMVWTGSSDSESSDDWNRWHGVVLATSTHAH